MGTPCRCGMGTTGGCCCSEPGTGPSLQIDLDTLRYATLTGAKQNSLARILAWTLDGLKMSPGEVRQAIKMAGTLVGHQEVLNYEHPLLHDPVVSCASKEQLEMHLVNRFDGTPNAEGVIAHKSGVIEGVRMQVGARSEESTGHAVKRAMSGRK